MSYIEADLRVVEENGKKVVNNIAEVQKLLNEFYGRLSGIYHSGEASGGNMTLYCRTVERDKAKYMDYTNGIKEIGKKMIDFSSDTEDLVRKTENKLSGD